MTSAVVIGQSHSNAISQALDECGGIQGISVYRLADSKRPLERNSISLAEAVEIAAQLPLETKLFLSVLGTYHNILGMLRSGHDFDFFLDVRDIPNREQRLWIPHRALANAFEQQFAETKSVRKIRAAAKSTTYLVSSPPPKQSNEFMLQRLMRQKTQTYRGKSIREVGVEKADSRLKLWRLESRLMQAWAESEGMQFLAAPSGAFNADGFLSRKFYSDDATHANARYGALVVKQICELICEERQEAVHG